MKSHTKESGLFFIILLLCFCNKTSGKDIFLLAWRLFIAAVPTYCNVNITEEDTQIMSQEKGYFPKVQNSKRNRSIHISKCDENFKIVLMRICRLANVKLSCLVLSPLNMSLFQTEAMLLLKQRASVCVCVCVCVEVRSQG